MINSIEVPDDALSMDPQETYDKAITGVKEGRVVYDMEKVVEAGVAIFGSYDASLEYHDFNTFCAYVGAKTPIFESNDEEIQ